MKCSCGDFDNPSGSILTGYYYSGPGRHGTHTPQACHPWDEYGIADADYRFGVEHLHEEKTGISHPPPCPYCGERKRGH